MQLDQVSKVMRFNHIAGQLLRSGTSPLPNHGEVQAAESANDFVHKLKVCLSGAPKGQQDNSPRQGRRGRRPG